MNDTNKTVIFEHGEVQLEITIIDNTGWLSIKQMAELFSVSEKTVRRYISATYNECMLSQEETCRKLDKVHDINGQNIVDGIKKKKRCTTI